MTIFVSSKSAYLGKYKGIPSYIFTKPYLAVLPPILLTTLSSYSVQPPPVSRV
jgi:hypothetical protein